MYTHTNMYQQQSSGYLQEHFDILAQHLPPERERERVKEIGSRRREREEKKKSAEVCDFAYICMCTYTCVYTCVYTNNYIYIYLRVHLFLHTVMFTCMMLLIRGKPGHEEYDQEYTTTHLQRIVGSLNRRDPFSKRNLF